MWFLLLSTAVLVSQINALPVKATEDATDWYTDSASGISSVISARNDGINARSELNRVLEAVKRDETDWYTDSAAGVAETLGGEKREESTNWYTDSAAGIAESLVEDKRDKATNWYTDSAAGVAGSLAEHKRDEETNWYTDSAAGIAGSLVEGKRDEGADWYKDSASGIADSLDNNKRNTGTDWYTDSTAGIAKSLANPPSKREADEDVNWYSDSASGVASSLNEAERREIEDKTNWYSDSSSGIAESLSRRAMTSGQKEKYEKSLREWIYHDMRREPLRKSSERGKAFFEFTPKPRNDLVDRQHVPAELRERFDSAKTDAERVSMLNYYLMVTGREPKPASELGFQPTFDKPGLTEKNEVGFGYALAGQHQMHCTNFVADAIDIGKANLNDFFLKHTIHCLGLLKYLAPQLTMKQPTSFLLPEANERVANNYPQTIEGEEM